MDFAAALKNEFVRPFLTLVAPGAVAITPYVLMLASQSAGVRALLADHTAYSAALLAGLAITAGLAMEELGEAIEAYAWDPLLSAKNPAHIDNWHAYLKLFLRDEIVAHRRLRDVLTKMKFELAMAPALVVALGGTIWLMHASGRLTYLRVYGLSVAVITAVSWLLLESYKSARILARLRTLILEAVPEYRKA